MIKRNNIQRLTIEEVFDLAEFVVKENVKHHSNDFVDIRNALLSIAKEECLYYKNAKIFVSKTCLNQIEGAIRVLKWNYKDQLPLQKIFGIHPFDILGNSPLKTIWHIGRFAISKECKDILLFKKLMICAIKPICENENSVAFAECDSKLLRILNLIGINAVKIGNSVNYLGSETIPVCIPYEGLINFYNKNKHLISNNMFSTETSKLHFSLMYKHDKENIFEI